MSTLLADLEPLLPGILAREAADPEGYPEQTVRDLFAAGLPQAPFAATDGGRGATLREAATAIELLASASPSAALIIAMPMGLAGVLASDPAVLGADAAAFIVQRERIADDYRLGRVYAACNSEKGAGGSLAATKTFATKRPAGGFALNGEKILASSGRFAHTFLSTAKVAPEDLPGAGIVEFFLVEVASPGVEVLADWDGFGMRSTESQSVCYTRAPARELLGPPGFIGRAQPVQYFYALFAAIPLGCAKGMLDEMSSPAPESPALRLRLSEALMRYEALRAYLLETADGWRLGAGPAYAARMLRTKTYVTQESTRLCADLFALGGGRHYRRGGRLAGLLADSFAGTALRPPLALALESLVEGFGQ
jgi:alkylation response protein AidB-like acyl-CoA dehydrogenase